MRNDARATLRERALALHRAGQVAEAERGYAQLLRDDPRDLTALIASAAALRELGRPEQALARASAALALQPSAEAWIHRGAALRDLGRLPEALDCFDQALALVPASVEALNQRGIVLQQLQRSGEALLSFERAGALRPQSPELHNNRGNVLRALRRYSEALASFERATALAPGFAAAHNNRGLALQALGRHADAAASYQRALELQPELAEAWNNLGTAQCELGEAAAALASGRRSLALRPAALGVRGNLGNALRDLERPEEALAEYELALAEDRLSADNHCHRGNALFDLGRLEQARACYDRALELDPQHVQAHFNKGLSLLLEGDYLQGLPLYEWRRQLRPPVDLGGLAPWRGEPLAGRTLFVHADQALGDTLQLCRYAPLAAARGARVILAAQSQLGTLLSTLGEQVMVVPPGAPPPGCDFHCALGSLPLAFGTTLASIPAQVPYLAAQSARIGAWRARLGETGFKVGIAWQGSRNRIDVGRSVPLALFAPLASIPGVRLISLQKGAALEELRAAGAALPIEIPAEPFDAGPQAFLDSAAIMMSLDLIVSCDTALAHLAGALGRPTWIALKSVPDWRWLLGRSDTPWYPSARLFRQPRRGAWHEVFAAIGEQLLRLARTRA